MSSISWTRLPFRFETPDDYRRQLSAWIGHAFYEVLPAAGYQVREEQIYFAYRVAAALEQARPLLAEAGSGTGKTFGYLLPALCHARLRGQPVVIATASAALESQLAGPDGDIATLSRLLGLQVDARVARRPVDVVCDIRLERFAALRGRRAGRTSLLRWSEGSTLGARSEFPAAADGLWAEVAWNAGCRCDVCPRRGYCRLMRGRAAARAAADFVVCGHDLFFEDTLGRDRLPPGRLPVLPPFSGAVFDEGHRVAVSAQRAAGCRLHPQELREAIRGGEGQGVRVRLLQLVEAAAQAADRWERALLAATGPDAGEARRAVAHTPELLAATAALGRLLARLQDEMAIEEGLHEETAYAARLSILQTRLEEAGAACRALPGADQVLFTEQGALWVVPSDLGPLWRRGVPAGTPLIFSSATLAAAGSFDYTARALGLDRPMSASVGVPFRLAAQVLCYLPQDLPARAAPDFWPRTATRVARLLLATSGRALLLLPDARALEELRRHLQVPQRMLWEGDAAPEALLGAFAADTAACLAGCSFWEGVDVPGETLSAVVVPLLPLPGADPLVQARRDAARAAGGDPFAAVDVPEMALRLKQGLGRLIRTETDRGVVALLETAAGAAPGRASLLAPAIEAALPAGARHVRTLPPVARFLAKPG